MEIVFNIALTSIVLSIVLLVSKTNTTLGGFIVSLPISTLIVLAFSRIQNGDVGDTFALAKSVFVAVPLTLVFFIPFLVADKLKLNFWVCYFSGILLLGISYVLHKKIMENWG